MSHHLTYEQRLEVHRKHVEAGGGYASIIADNPQNDLDGRPVGNWRFEFCTRCGLPARPTCDHEHMFWTHRPGCRKYDAATFSVPEGLVDDFSKAFPQAAEMAGLAGEDCTGCLLLCPLCGADGT